MSTYRVVGGDVGTKIIFTVREWPIGTTPVPNGTAPILDISTATNPKLILIPPAPILSQGVAQNTVTASFYTDGTDGNLQYITVSGDIPAAFQSQTWQVRASFTMAGWSGKSETDYFVVDP